MDSCCGRRGQGKVRTEHFRLIVTARSDHPRVAHHAGWTVISQPDTNLTSGVLAVARAAWLVRPESTFGPVVSAHNSYMTEARFSAKQWLLKHADDWLTWIESSRTSRIKRMSRLAEGVRQLTLRWVASPEQAERVVLELPRTLGRCNELAFSSESETLAYTIWHLVDRYARIIQVLDELVRRGQLPLRKTRLSVLEIGAGPSPGTPCS